MKREYAKLFSFLLGITFILSGIIFTVVKTYKEERQTKIDEENQIIDEIMDIYEVFKKKTEEFSNKRDEVNSEISDYVAYYTGMITKYDSIIKTLESYETMVTEVEDTAIYLKDHCLKNSYSSIDANSKCTSYIMNYEKSVNSFVGDIEFFNSKIKEYNEWATKENSELQTEKYKSLESFVPKIYKEYIDINNDGTYLGRASD